MDRTNRTAGVVLGDSQRARGKVTGLATLGRITPAESEWAGDADLAGKVNVKHLSQSK